MQAKVAFRTLLKHIQTLISQEQMVRYLFTSAKTVNEVPGTETQRRNFA
jgi:hypothetical protein